MSVFQRRLASSTYALLRSFERRAEKLAKLIEDMRSGRLSQAQFTEAQQQLEKLEDALDEKTADEEEMFDNQEENERSEEQLMGGVLATSLAELQDELQQVEMLLDLARRVYLVATDAAGEGINPQVCWLMVNYDIPWNPARLEQRMGRIHRYGQKHDPVHILNLVAGKTREGRVMQTLLEKMERIRRELGSDKVFDVIGQLFEGVSLREWMEQVAMATDDHEVQRRIAGKLTQEQVRALQARELALYGEGGAVRSELPRLKASMELETYRKLLPGYVRHFMERAAPLVDISIEEDLEGVFTLRPLKPGAMDWLLPILETYPPSLHDRYTVHVPRNGEQAIFLHPGEPVFDRFRAFVCEHFTQQARQGAGFVDPTAERPYFYHLAQVVVTRQAHPTLHALNRPEIIEYRLVGLRQEEGREVEECPVESLLLLRGSPNLPDAARSMAATIESSSELAQAYALSQVAQAIAGHHRHPLLQSLP